MDVNGTALAFDILNPEHIERADKAERELEKKLGDAPDIGDGDLSTYATFLRIVADAYADYLDSIFGAGTAKKLLPAECGVGEIVDIAQEVRGALETSAKASAEKLMPFLRVK